MALEFITQNSIFYVLIIWVAVVVLAKVIHLEKRGFEVKPYSITYKNQSVEGHLTKFVKRFPRGTKLFANVSVVAGFAMMGFAFWFLAYNISNYFVQPESFSEVTVLIPGVTIQSGTNIAYFLLSVPIVLVMHEGAHGVVAVLEKIKIKTGGFAIFIALFAGFVEPDDDEFNKSKKVSKLRVIGAGATSNVIFSFIIAGLLLFHPTFALIMPEPIRGYFYEDPLGVPIVTINDGSGADAAGLKPDDIITKINNVNIRMPQDFEKVNLDPGQTAQVSVLRDGKQMEFSVETTASPEDPERGLIGISRSTVPSFEPKSDFYIPWDPVTFMFLLWLWMLSFFIGIFNMLPLPILDGGKFIQSIIEKKIPEKTVKNAMWGIYSATFLLFALNIAFSAAKSGFIVI